MKELSIAFGAYLAIATLLFISLSLSGVEASVGVQVYPALAVIVPIIFEALKETRDRKARQAGEAMVVRYEKFGIHPALMMFYSLIVVFSISGVAWMMAHPKSVHSEEELASANTYLGFLLFLAIFLVTKWIAERCRGSLIHAGVVAGCWSVFFIAMSYLGGGYDRVRMDFIAGVVILASVLGLGFWWGRKRRVYAYIEYLFNSVDPTTRSIFLELIREEAQKVPAARAIDTNTQNFTGIATWFLL